MPEFRIDRVECAKEKCYAGAKGYQRIHVRSSMLQFFKSAYEIVSSKVKDNRER